MYSAEYLQLPSSIHTLVSEAGGLLLLAIWAVGRVLRWLRAVRVGLALGTPQELEIAAIGESFVTAPFLCGANLLALLERPVTNVNEYVHVQVVVT